MRFRERAQRATSSQVEGCMTPGSIQQDPSRKNISDWMQDSEWRSGWDPSRASWSRDTTSYHASRRKVV